MPKDRKLTYSDRQSSAAKKAPKKTANTKSSAPAKQAPKASASDTTD